MARYYLAPSLVTLRNEINVAHPNRDKTSDGWIGDPSHSARRSDHNPDYNAAGVVRATDTDKDGIDTSRALEVVVRDVRTQYVIWAGFIYSRAYQFRKRVYNGANKHYGHIHLSIRHGKQYEDDTRPWGYSAPKIVENGNFDSATIKALQERLNGWHSARPQLRVDGDFGTATKRALQAMLNHVRGPVAIDGDFGPRSIQALQRHLNVPVDSSWGPNTTRSLQRRLNAGTF